MAIACNGNMVFARGVQSYGAAAYLSAYPSVLDGNFCMTNKMRNITAGQGIADDKVSLPSGYRHPKCWMMPQKAGAIAARNTLTGSGTIAGTALAVKLALADITGSGTLSATGGLIVQALADLTGSGTISSANLQAFLAAVAAISGSGTAAGTATGLGAAIAALTGSGTAATSILTAIGELDADITVTGTGLSTANVGQAVWTYLIENGLSAEQIQRVLLAFAAGDATGLENGSPNFKAQDGATTRIDGTYASGTRTVTTVNGD